MFSKIIARRSLFSASKRNFASAQEQWKQSRIVVAGCQGQIGHPLVHALCDELGHENVVCSDKMEQKFDFPCKFERLDVTDESGYRKFVEDHKTTYIVHLAGILSALGEQQPDLAIDVNIGGVINGLRIAKDQKAQIFIPSSIAAFGGDIFQKDNTPVDSILQPTTVYGVSKVFAEQMGSYFADKYEMDFRCLRYPGVISSEKFAFNGTTDYSTEIFFHAMENKYYKCWLHEKSELPMIYIDDCVTATIQYLKADKARLTRNVYNLAGKSFTPEQFNPEVQKLIPGLQVEYEPDFRQAIADSWTNSMDDKECKQDWDWSYDISTADLAKKIFDGIDPEYKKNL